MWQGDAFSTPTHSHPTHPSSRGHTHQHSCTPTHGRTDTNLHTHTYTHSPGHSHTLVHPHTHIHAHRHSIRHSRSRARSHPPQSHSDPPTHTLTHKPTHTAADSPPTGDRCQEQALRGHRGPHGPEEGIDRAASCTARQVDFGEGGAAGGGKAQKGLVQRQQRGRGYQPFSQQGRCSGWGGVAGRGGGSWPEGLAWGRQAPPLSIIAPGWGGGHIWLEPCNPGAAAERAEKSLSQFCRQYPHSGGELGLVHTTLPQCLLATLGGLVSWGCKLATKRLRGAALPYASLPAWGHLQTPERPEAGLLEGASQLPPSFPSFTLLGALGPR